MKTFSDAAIAALVAGTAIVTGAVFLDCAPAVRVWGGFGDLVIGEETFLGVGNAALAQVTGGAVGGAAQNVTLSLSGVDSVSAGLLDSSSLRSCPAVLYRCVFDKSGTHLLDAQVFAQGRLDQLTVEDTPNGTSTITALLEGAAQGMGRAGGRLASDADQRLISPTDGGFRKVSYAGTITLYWGGQKPATASQALPGASNTTPSLTAAQQAAFNQFLQQQTRFF